MVEGSPVVYRLRGISVLAWFFSLFAVLLNFYVFYFWPTMGLFAIGAGTWIGAMASYLLGKRELRVIETKGERKFTITTLLWTIGGLVVIFAALWLFLPQNLWIDGPPRNVTGAMNLFFAPIPAAIIETRIYVIRQWERRNRRKILTDEGFFTSKLYASTPPPTTPNPEPN